MQVQGWYLGSESRIWVMQSRQVGLVPGIRVQNTGDAVQACGGAGTWDQSPEYGCDAVQAGLAGTLDQSPEYR